ncbi:protein bric-a-brac 2-like isoform X3 [Macrobrachium nipponense]|uniref:protein bric-a-brac 2-like isoform X3 n=1 Tax=Macrobrachium nipponense TaxID=159736 RepID=UPI0030C897B4
MLESGNTGMNALPVTDDVLFVRRLFLWITPIYTQLCSIRVQYKMSEYCLRWNNHRPNLVTVFSELLTSEALVDVTLATDGHYIHAHKLVLSACSVYFKDLFGANPCKHPIVILKDIRIDDLKTVIDFIYRGEVNVAQDRLQDVLKTAESLRIKGLAENPRNYDEIPCQSTRFPSSGLGPQVARQRSSLTDSREQSLSLEGEEDGEPGTPPSSKRRKITSSHDSSESQHDEQENDNTNRVLNVKDEPVDDRENDKSHSGDTEQESNVNRVADAMLMLQGASQDSGEDSGNAAGTSADATLSSSHSQGPADWSLQQLSPWWASVLPALTRHHHHHRSPALRPPPLHPSMAHLPSMRSMAAASGGGGGGIGSCGRMLGTASGKTVDGGGGGGGVGGNVSPRPPVTLPLDQMSLVAVLGKEVSPQMIQALQAVAARRESFSSAAKLYAVSVTTLWRYSKKLGLTESSHK